MHDDECRSQSLLRELLTAEIRRAPDAAFEALAEHQRRLHELELTASKPDSHGRAGHRVARLTHPDAGRSAEPSEGDDPATSEQLLARLEENPEPGALAVCLRSLWHDHGALEECLPLLVRHAELVARMPSEAQQLAQHIWGAATLEDGLARNVPVRSQGPAYLPERGRIMYCAPTTPVYDTSGWGAHTRGLVSGLRESGGDVFVMARGGYPWDCAVSAGGAPSPRRLVTSLDGIDCVHRPEGDLQSMRVDDYVQVAADAFVREARLQRPSLIHAASNFRTALPALIAARRLGLPFVHEVRGLWEIDDAARRPGWEETERCAWETRMEVFVASQADAVLVISPQIRDELLRRGIAQERITLLPEGVDAAALLPLTRDTGFARQHLLSAKVPVIGFAGTFAEHEGLELLLQAANILRGRKAQFQIALAGDGAAHERLRAGMQRYAFASRMRLLGRLEPEDVPRFLSCADIVVSPRVSVPDSAAASWLKPLEAYAASKPTVLSDIPAHRALAGAQQERGLLFEPGDARSLANALHRLIKDAELRTAMGRAARLWVVDERQWPDLAGRVLEAHRAAQESYRTEAQPGRELSELRIGLLAEQPGALQDAVAAVNLDRERWQTQVREQQLDLVLVDSAAMTAQGGSLVDLLEACRDAGVPSVLWDSDGSGGSDLPFDHVLTIDADRIGEHLRRGHDAQEGVAVTGSTMPIFADPAVDNPLPGRSRHEDAVVCSSAVLAEHSPRFESLLSTAERAADGRLLRAACGVDGIASLHLEPSTDSPSAFSRSVVQIAAAGGVVLSSRSRGIQETFDDRIPSTDDRLRWGAHLHAWVHDPRIRLQEAWLQLRTVLRSHTVHCALVLLARTAGVPVHGLRLPAWACDLDSCSAERVLAQSVLPTAVRLAEGDEGLRRRAEAAGMTVLEPGEQLPADLVWWAQLPPEAGRTWAEDMLWATMWGRWDAVGSRTQASTQGDGRPLARAGQLSEDVTGAMRRCRGGGPGAAGDAQCLTLELPAPEQLSEQTSRSEQPQRTLELQPRQGPVLIAGHDFKFADSWIAHLEAQGVEVLLDEWSGHEGHDEQRSAQLLERAASVFCEWGLGNAVWYSHHVRPDQRLVIRVHKQELFLPHLGRIRHEAVDEFVFVGELIRDAAVRSHGIPREKTRVIPNIVHTSELQLPKTEEARFTVGLVGMVPQIKRLDRAVSVIESLARKDPRWCLRVKGKRPEEYAWMKRRETEMAWYQACFRRIDQLQQDTGRRSVVFDPHGDDIPQWFQGVGYALSVSDLESFHLTLPDGAASGAAPVSLAWPGADLIYPREWLVGGLAEMTERISALQADDQQREALVCRAGEFVIRTMDEPLVHTALDRTLRKGEVRAR